MPKTSPPPPPPLNDTQLAGPNCYRAQDIGVNDLYDMLCDRFHIVSSLISHLLGTEVTVYCKHVTPTCTAQVGETSLVERSVTAEPHY